jgi:hypothetical protein
MPERSLVVAMADFRVRETPTGKNSTSTPKTPARIPGQQPPPGNVDPRVMEVAMKLAGGDMARIRPQGDGSVVVRGSAVVRKA